LSSGTAARWTRSPTRTDPGGIETFTAATRRGPTVTITEFCTPSAETVIVAVPGATACTTPVV
jgi:hypothetical protein